VSVRVAAPAFALCFPLLIVAAPALAQSPPIPVPGFMPAYEVTRIVRASGFDPLAPPRREGATYVLRATDFRGILMRVVVDGHSGAIRAVNRIVPPDYPVAFDMLPPGAPAYGARPFGPPPYGQPPYRALPPDGMPYGGPRPAEANAQPGSPSFAPPAPQGLHASPRLPTAPPLPRPRPAELAEQMSTTISAAPRPTANAGAKTGAAAAAPVAPSKPAQVPIND
jgi:hypothetical protein